MQGMEADGDRPLSLAADAGRIVGRGEMADRVRGYDWSSTPLGHIGNWSPELVAIVNLTLSSPSPTRTMWGPDLILIYNDAYRPLPGPRHPEALGMSARLVYPETWPEVGPLLERAFKTGEAVFHEKLRLSLRQDHGMEDAYLNYSFNPIYQDGKIAGLFGQLHNVTGEVTAAQRLRESEATALRILQSIGDAVIVTDAEGRVGRMNSVAEGLTGWRIEEAGGRRLDEVFQIVNEETRRPVESPVDKVRRTRSVIGLSNHTILISRDGKETSIDDSGAPIFVEDGSLSGIVLVFRNIDERRAAEREKERVTEQLRLKSEELERQKIEIESLYKSAPIGLAFFDTEEFRYLRLNDRQAEFFGLKPEEIVGRTLTEMAPIEGLRELFEQVLAGKPVINYPLEGELVTRPGEHRYWMVSYFPVLATDGTVQGITAASLEITQQKKAEQALMQSEKLAVAGRFAASIAHEINNPLESVTNLLYLASNSNDLSQIKDYIDTAEIELRRASAITSQTLRFYKQSTAPRQVTSAELIESVVHLYESRATNAGVRIGQRLRAGTAVRCFEGEVRQVLSNLVGNAIDAMQPAGGRLLLRSREATHWPTGRKGVVLTVADTGCGIPGAAQKKIFEPFYTTKGIGGTGLGLWVSCEIVVRHGGTLRVRSRVQQPGTGTVFTVFLPFDAVDRSDS